MLKMLLMPALLLSASLSSAAFAGTYQAGTYQDLYDSTKIDTEAYANPLNSIDRVMIVAQALLLEKKITTSQTIKSITEIETDDDDKPNVKIELVDSVTGACTLLKATVYNGYLDHLGKSSETLNTIVQFAPSAARCK